MIRRFARWLRWWLRWGANETSHMFPRIDLWDPRCWECGSLTSCPKCMLTADAISRALAGFTGPVATTKLRDQAWSWCQLDSRVICQPSRCRCPR